MELPPNRVMRQVLVHAQEQHPRAKRLHATDYAEHFGCAHCRRACNALWKDQVDNWSCPRTMEPFACRVCCRQKADSKPTHHQPYPLEIRTRASELARTSSRPEPGTAAERRCPWLHDRAPERVVLTCPRYQSNFSSGDTRHRKGWLEIAGVGSGDVIGKEQYLRAGCWLDLAGSVRQGAVVTTGLGALHYIWENPTTARLVVAESFCAWLECLAHKGLAPFA